MPRFDGTGPEGKGEMTGRGIGKCVPKKKLEETKGEKLKQEQTRGFGLGRGHKGRGR